MIGGRYILLFILASPFWAIAQENGLQGTDVADYVERIFAIQEDNVNYNDLYESLLLLYTNPINLNRTSEAELRSLFLLSESQTQSFFRHIDRNGSLLSIYELQAVPGFDDETIRLLLPFVSLKANNSATGKTLIERIKEEDNNFLILRLQRTLETEQGFTDEASEGARFLGDRNTLYARYRLSRPKDFSLGFTIEKDAGERLAFNPNQNQFGFDYYSAHLVLDNFGPFKRLAIGDYQLQLGQGLLLGSGFTAGKGSETVLTTRRNTLGIRPYTSTQEASFLRGIAATYSFNNFDFTGFYSIANRDANVNLNESIIDTVFTESDTTLIEIIPEDDFITSLRNTGLHRSLNELGAKGQVREQILGANIIYRHPQINLEVGATFLQVSYNRALLRAPTRFNQFEFNGDQNLNIGFFYNYTIQNFNFFGEAARSQSGGIGVVSGVVASLSKAVDISLVFRNYDRDFHTFFGNAFSERSRNINERGFYWGLKAKPIRSLTWTAYFDRFEFPWLLSRADAPSSGYEFLSRITYSPKRNTSLYFQFRQEGTERNSLSEVTPAINSLDLAIRRNYRFNIEVNPSPILNLRSRLQLNTFSLSGESTNGFLIAQDVNLSFKKFKISSRFSLFDVEDFENREYIYERNVLYAFSIPFFNGTGVRTYILGQYKPTDRITLWARWAQTRFRNQTQISSGLNAIEGDTQNDIALQIRYNF